MPPVEPDQFWGTRAAPRTPRWRAERYFDSRLRPHPSTPLLVKTTSSASRFALALLFGGLFGGLLYQLSGLGLDLFFVAVSLLPPPIGTPVTILSSVALVSQLVSLVQANYAVLAIGAPLFEELFKAGVALLLCAPLALVARTRARPVVVAVRILVGAGIGAGFGALEHLLPQYRQEDLLGFTFRLVFHSGSTALSMTAYSVLEGVGDRRALWFATLPSTVLHYLNNGYILLVALVAGDRAVALYSMGIGVATFAAIPMVMAFAGPLRRLATRQAMHRLGRPPVKPQAGLAPGWRPPA